MEAVKGSQLDRCGYPLSGLPREPPGVHVPLQLHHRRLGQHSPVHSSAVVGDPWRPDSHQPTPAPPPPSSTERPFGCGALWAPSSTRAVAPQPVQPALVAPRAGKHTLCPGAPPSAQGTPSAVGADPAREAAPPVPKAVKECGSDPSRATYHRLPVPIGSRGVVG